MTIENANTANQESPHERPARAAEIDAEDRRRYPSFFFEHQGRLLEVDGLFIPSLAVKDYATGEVVGHVVHAAVDVTFEKVMVYEGFFIALSGEPRVRPISFGPEQTQTIPCALAPPEEEVDDVDPFFDDVVPF